MSDPSIILTRFELPVKDKFLVEPDTLTYPVDFYVESDKLYMDGAVVKGERPFNFYVYLIKDGTEIPMDLLEYGMFFGGVTVKGTRYFLFLTEG